ncbi:MAG: hypothetical protein HY541_06245 [Deltaproteobacteria bacterium]|nr:hypothetical protein [Deltaproteobacteria bacterium]
MKFSHFHTASWLILAALFFVSVFVISQAARGQGKSGGDTPVGVIPEGPPADAPPEEEEEPDINPYVEMTLNLSGGGCEINLNESELLRVKGVVGVDIEKKPGKIVLEYDPAVTNKGLIKSAVGKKKGGCAANEEAGGGNP